MERRIADKPKVFLSLSGGYESSAILGILASKLGYTEVCCFSYGLDGYVEGSDAYCARRMTSLYGMEHLFLQSYEGDPLEVVELNAALGEGIAFFCDEATVWPRLKRHFENGAERGVIFVGDNSLFYSDLTSRCPEEALRVVKVYDLTSLSWFSDLIGAEAFASLRDALGEEIRAVIRRIDGSGVEGGDAEGFFYLDQRLAHVIMPWREFFCGSAMTVRNPILDCAVVEFFMMLPSPLRVGRKLYIATVREMFPELFAIPRARFLNSAPDWRGEFIAARDEIVDAVCAKRSRLDQVIPQETVIRLLDELKRSDLGAWKYRLGGVKSRIVSRLSIMQERLAGSKDVPVEAQRVDAAELLKRLLILRAFLA